MDDKTTETGKTEKSTTTFVCNECDAIFELEEGDDRECPECGSDDIDEDEEAKDNGEIDGEDDDEDDDECDDDGED